MSALAVEQRDVAYRVASHADGTPEPGRLLVGPASVCLLDYWGSAVAELAFADLKALRLPAATRRRRPIILESRHSEWIEIESADRWMLLHLLEQVTSHLLRTMPPHGQLVVSVRLHPGSLQHADQLFGRCPPFAGQSTSMRRVFILDDEILLVLATSTNRQEGSAQETVLRDVITASYESVCEIEIAEPADAGIVNAVEVTSGE